MSKLRVNAFTVSADGFGAGVEQSLDQPLGRGGERLHQWFVPTATFRQYLKAGLIDELHVAQSPVLLGQGETLFAGIDLPALGYRVKESVTTEKAVHLVIVR